MIVSCPECGAKYRLADDAIPAEGRAMRCASCKHRWFELGPEPEAVVAPPFVLTPEPVEDTSSRADAIFGQDSTATPAAPRIDDRPPEAMPVVDADDDPPRGHPVLKTLFALLLGAGFSAAAAAMWVPADQLPVLDLSRVPWLAAVIDPPKAPPSPLRLSFRTDPQPVAGGRTLYALAATLSNPTDTAQAVPALEGRLVDASGAVTYRWSIPAPAGVLLPGQQVAFDASALGAPGETVTIAH